MFNVRDIVKYKTLINSHENWGVIVEILNVEDSVHQEAKGVRLYRVNPLNTSISYEFIEEKNIIQAYSMYYEEKGEQFTIQKYYKVNRSYKMNDLKLKAIIQKTKKIEEKFWENYEDETSEANDLLDSAITIMRLKGNIITELNRKIVELQQEVLDAYEDGLNEE